MIIWPGEGINLVGHCVVSFGGGVTSGNMDNVTEELHSLAYNRNVVGRKWL